VELIGQGTYGRVYKVRRRSDGRLLVLKSIPFDGLSVEEQQETLVEVKERASARGAHNGPTCGACGWQARVMSRVESPFVIRYEDSFLEKVCRAGPRAPPPRRASPQNRASSPS
jgi:hypothetical protein